MWILGLYPDLHCTRSHGACVHMPNCCILMPGTLHLRMACLAWPNIDLETAGYSYCACACTCGAFRDLDLEAPGNAGPAGGQGKAQRNSLATALPGVAGRWRHGQAYDYDAGACSRPGRGRPRRGGPVGRRRYNCQRYGMHGRLMTGGLVAAVPMPAAAGWSFTCQS